MAEMVARNWREPVRPKNTVKAFFKSFRCKHHWTWVYPGNGRTPWRQCWFCKWRIDDSWDH